MDKLQYMLMVIGVVTWTILVCWCVYYITHDWKFKTPFQKHDTHYRDGDNT